MSNSDRVKEMIRDKFKAAGHFSTVVEEQSTAVPKHKSYDEAREQSDVLEMIRIKSGYYKQLEQQAQLEAMLGEIDIVAVTTELKGIDGKIEKASSDHKAKLEKDKAELKAEYEVKLQQFYRRGGMKGSPSEAILQDKYVIALRELEAQGETTSDELAVLLDRKKLLTIAKETYMKENADLISDLQRVKRMKEIQDAGLLSDID